MPVSSADPQSSSTSAEVSELTVVGSMTSWSGPLPPPELIAAYEETVPGSAALILKEFAEEAAHRRALERQQANLVVRETHLGQILAIVFALAALGVAAYAAAVGQPWIGSIVGGGVIISGITALLNGRKGG